MHVDVTRRDFLKGTASALSLSVMGAAPTLLAAAPKEKGAKKPTKQFLTAVKIGMIGVNLPLVDKFKLLKEIGYDGVELNGPSDLKVDEVLAAQDASGLPVHGVVDSVHWKETLSHPDPAVRAQGLAGLQQALRDAKAYGASSVLLVPAVVNKEVSYADAYTRSQAEIKKALPLAEELNIRLLFENVWNSFLLSPLEMARYIDEFDSPIVGAYFDVGNVVRYGWPEQWVRILGKRIAKLDIKEYSREIESTKGPHAGFSAEIGEGDCDWPAVVAALTEIGYSGWATAEVRGGDAARLKDIHARMQRVLVSA